jgi:type VI protein secretion system component Hcp
MVGRLHHTKPNQNLSPLLFFYLNEGKGLQSKISLLINMEVGFLSKYYETPTISHSIN